MFVPGIRIRVNLSGGSNWTYKVILEIKQKFIYNCSDKIYPTIEKQYGVKCLHFIMIVCDH